jgi:hypothetical protein
VRSGKLWVKTPAPNDSESFYLLSHLPDYINILISMISGLNLEEVGNVLFSRPYASPIINMVLRFCKIFVHKWSSIYKEKLYKL